MFSLFKKKTPTIPQKGTKVATITLNLKRNLHEMRTGEVVGYRFDPRINSYLYAIKFDDGEVEVVREEETWKEI